MKTEEKQSVTFERVLDYLGKKMRVDLKNYNYVIGIMAYYHLDQQMIHLNDWEQYDSKGILLRKGRYMVINRTAWYQLIEA